SLVGGNNLRDSIYQPVCSAWRMAALCLSLRLKALYCAKSWRMASSLTSNPYAIVRSDPTYSIFRERAMQNVHVAKFIARHLANFTFVLLLNIALAVTSWAQSTTAPDRGFKPAGSYAIGDIENINNFSGNLSL